MKLTLIAVACAAAFSATSAAAAWQFAQGRFSGFGQMEWESSCRKPTFPMASYASEWEADNVTADYRRYTRCLADQAGADSRYAAGRVIEEAEDELEDVKRDARLAGWDVR